MSDDPAVGGYRPFAAARRPGSSPETKPAYRVLVHKQYMDHWNQLVNRVGIQQAQQFWDHVATNPGGTDPIAQTTILKGKVGDPMGPGWSKTVHYEISGAGRINFQFNNAFKGGANGDGHKVVAIRTISYGSH